ncbi:hypothetical protein B0A49_03352 [Cryomyces minteri]|uniref:CRAL-TRIO domain-containing protein n=1 Tax=Cryomyces minteri TaxID=331657 RepID=A0A4V5NFP4_9PEZI|nr:hypothetical protein B0A49_03352 [Cryomyces minteri]
MASRAKQGESIRPVTKLKKRGKPAEPSSDFNSSGPSAAKHVDKRRRVEQSSPSKRTALAEKSTNIPSIPFDVPCDADGFPDFISYNHEVDSSQDGSNPLETSFDRLRLDIFNKLEQHHKARDHPDLQKVRSAKTSDDLARLLSDHGWWTPFVLGLFTDKPVREMSLSRSVDALSSPSPYLAQLFRQGTFSQLSTLDLSGIPLSLNDVSLLRLLPRLVSLNIANTSATDHHLLHLATHAATLTHLDLSNNAAINDDCRVPLTALYKLENLHLRGTEITVPCLRLLVYALPPECRFVTLPQPCLDHLNGREKRYCAATPAGYVQDPRQVPNLTLAMLKRNLELHKEANRDVQLTGGKVDLVDRLMDLLCARVADGRIAKRDSPKATFHPVDAMAHRSHSHDTDLARIESYQYPAAHIGHLSPPQQAALDSFKQLCQRQGYYRPAGPQGEASHDDETLLRYLRARKFDPKQAFGQFKDTEDWRKENELDRLYDTIDVDEYEETRKLYPQWTGRRDKRGIPVYVFEVGGLNSKAVSAYEHSTSRHPSVSTKIPTKMLRLFALYENLTSFVMPLCSGIPDRPHPETPISQSNNIVDISKVGLKQFWNLKQHMQDASTLATAHYPETLDRIFIIGAPSFFPTVWGWIKRWFDPITVSKIFILSSSNMRSTLEQYIEPANIPKKYGGQLDFEFGMMPVLEPIIQKNLQWEAPSMQKSNKTFPTGPIRWKETGNGDIVAIAVGSEHGKERNRTIATLQRRSSKPDVTFGMNANTNTLARPNALYRTTTGVSTHPPDHPDMYNTNEPSPPAESPPAGPGAAGTFTLPYRDPFASTSSAAPDRQGTSATKYEQQGYTHASGKMAEGTPAVNDHGHGDKTVTMDPRTVGQAPKEYPGPDTEEPKETSYVTQAKEVATNAYESAASAAGSASQTVMAAVGYGASQTTGTQPKHEEALKRHEDSRVDRIEGQDIEEFLRARYASEPAGT